MWNIGARPVLSILAVVVVSHASTPLDCDFETPDLCGYVQDPYDTADWIRHNGPTPNVDTGPTVDHTFGNSSGHYMYYDPTLKFSFVHLWSPAFTPTGKKCSMVFHYLMYGQRVNWLGVSLGSMSSNYSLGQGLINKYGAHSLDPTDWRMGQVDLPTTGPPVNVVFQAQGTTGDIAIDDIKVYCDGNYNPASGCAANPCHHGGACTNVGQNGFQCTCVSGYTGFTCDIASAGMGCQSSPCHNGGVCGAVGQTGFRCSCPRGYTGPTCDTVSQVQGHTAAVHITADPQSIKEGTTDYLKVNCTFGHLLGSQFDALSYLVLYKSDTADDTNYKEVASVSSTSFQVVTKDDLGAHVTGLLNAAGVSYISYEWYQPKESTKGRYMCEAQGMDTTGRPVTSHAIAQVADVIANFNLLKNQIDQLNATMLSLQSGGGSVQVAQLESKLNNLTQLFNNQNLRLQNQATLIAGLQTALSAKDIQIQNQTMQINNLASQLQLQNNDCCNNKTAQIDIQLKDFQLALDNYGTKLDVQVNDKLDIINATVGDNSRQVSSCLAAQTADHSQLMNHTARLDDLLGKHNNRTTLVDGIFHQIDDSRTAVMQASAGFRGKYYFLSRPMWRNMAAYEGTCHLFGGHIVEISDQAEYDFLTQLIRDHNVTDGVVIGGTDSGNEGTWKFTASGLPMTYFNWAPSFPSSSVFENCVKIDGDAAWKMENIRCDAKEWGRFICEMDL